MFGTGPKAGNAIVSHPDIPLVSFTGSTATARLITERSAPHFKKLSLELGGKNPAVIFADADLDECIESTARSSFSNQVRERVLLSVLGAACRILHFPVCQFGTFSCLRLVKKTELQQEQKALRSDI